MLPLSMRTGMRKVIFAHRPPENLGHLRVELEQLGNTIKLLLRHFESVNLSCHVYLLDLCGLNCGENLSGHPGRDARSILCYFQPVKHKYFHQKLISS